MLNLRNKRNGVTLIALVVTIIVLLILAVVSFRVITGDDGILNKAETSAQESIKSQEGEILKLEQASFMIDQYTENGEKNKDLSVEIINKIKEHGQDVMVKKKDENKQVYLIIYTSSGNVWELDLEGGANYKNTVNPEEAPKVFDTDKPTLTITAGTDKLTLNYSDSTSNVVAYYYSTESTTPEATASGWVTLTTPSKEGTQDITGLESGTQYNVWVKDEATNVSEVVTKTTIPLPTTVRPVAFSGSGFRTGNEYDKSVDGNSNTFWYNEGCPKDAWIVYDFGNAYVFNSINFTVGNPESIWATQYVKVYGGNEGSDSTSGWISLFDEGTTYGLNRYPTKKDFNIVLDQSSLQSYRYIKIQTGFYSTGNFPWIIWEANFSGFAMP